MAERLGAGNGGEPGSVGGGGLERDGVLAVKLEFHAGKRRAGVAGKGVDHGFVRGQLPSEADVGELEDRLRGRAVLGVAIRVAFSRGLDEKHAVARAFGENLVPVEGDDLGGVDGVAEGDFQIRDGRADDQRIGNGGGGADRLVVRSVAGEMAVALEGADEVGAGEFLDADAGAFEIEGEHPVFAVAVSELADVF